MQKSLDIFSTCKIIRYFSLIIIFLLVNPIFSQTISTIEIINTNKFSPSTYRSWINIVNGSKVFPGILDTIEIRTINNLRNQGYYNSIVNAKSFAIDSTQIKVTLTILENEPTFIRNVNLIVSSVDSIYLTKNFPILKDEIFSKSVVERWIDNILDYYENTGFPFSSVKIFSLFFSYDTLVDKYYADITFQIEKNLESKIDKIEIVGNTKTMNNVITRAIGINIGDYYEQEKIDRITSRLNRLRFFEPVAAPEYYFNKDNLGTLKISIIEKETNNFDGIIGFVPGRDKNEKGYFTGSVNVGLRNLFGTGRALSFKWFQETKYSQELKVQYMEPWLFNLPVNIDFELFQRKQDTTYVQRILQGEIEYLASEDISGSLVFNTQSTIPSEQINNLHTVFNSNSFTSGINIKIDTRNDPYSPTKGFYIINSYKYTRKKINYPKGSILPSTKTDINFQRLEFDFGYFVELFSNQVGAISLHGRELRGSEFEQSDLYLLGGSTTLRGYREKQFWGNRILWSNLEYRYLISHRSFLFVFLDTGYFLRNENTLLNLKKISAFKFGYGLGLNIETALGILNVSFALGKEDSFSSGKIHFGVISEF
jgi:outer membrane protein insertion porin family